MGKIIPTNIDFEKSGLGKNRTPIINPNIIDTYDYIIKTYKKNISDDEFLLTFFNIARTILLK